MFQNLALLEVWVVVKWLELKFTQQLWHVASLAIELEKWICRRSMHVWRSIPHNSVKNIYNISGCLGGDWLPPFVLMLQLFDECLFVFLPVEQTRLQQWLLDHFIAVCYFLVNQLGLLLPPQLQLLLNDKHFVLALFWHLGVIDVTEKTLKILLLDEGRQFGRLNCYVHWCCLVLHRRCTRIFLVLTTHRTRCLQFLQFQF